MIQAYLDHLEEGAPEPSLDHLDSNDRELALSIINSLKAGRGIDPYQSRPSADTLLAGTEYEALAHPPARAGLTIDNVRDDVVSALGTDAEPIADGAAIHEGVRSDAVIATRGLRLRLQFRDDLLSAHELANVDPRAAAGPVYGRFPDTAGVILVCGDGELSSVAIGPYDTDAFIGAPDGDLHPPRVTHPVLPLFECLKLYVDEVAPDLSSSSVDLDRDSIDITACVLSATQSAVDAVVSEGERSRTEAKRDVWAGFASATDVIAAIVTDVSNGRLAGAHLAERVEEELAAA